MVSKLLLFPYWLTLRLRNRKYDSGKAQTTSFDDIPVISVGNITAGGTGKTPMVEYIIRMLQDEYKVAVLSRGYKRTSKGFHIVEAGDSALEAGDEPLQIKRKFPGVIVAVDKDRVRGVRQLKELPEGRPDVVILDDGFQYRRLKPALNIVLQDYFRPIFKDELLPLGRLRDLPEQVGRADVVICTKCPDMLNDWDKSQMKQLTRTRPEQEFLFARTSYIDPVAVFPESGDKRYIYSKEVFVFTGIASDKPILLHLSEKYEWISHEKYPDHHKFSAADIRHLNSFAHKHPRALILTTEKDAQRLGDCTGLGDEFKSRLFYMPVLSSFLSVAETRRFDALIRSLLPQKPVVAEPVAEPEPVVEAPAPTPKRRAKQKARPEESDWTLF